MRKREHAQNESRRQLQAMSDMLRLTWCLSGLLLLSAQSLAQDNPLFQSDDPLQITLELPLTTLVKDRNDRPVVEGVMRFRKPGGATAEIGMTMTTRGRSRLDYCRFPPIKINLQKKQTEGTVFQGQNKLKIVTHCRDGATHDRYLRQEFGIYKAYNALSGFSYRVRWVTVTYKDTENKRDDEVHDAFFIESNSEIEERLGRTRSLQNRIPSERLDPVESSKYALFQFLIANTDWSMLKGPGEEGCCHNGKVMLVPGSTTNWVVLPYDFDQAGLINTRYAIPSEGLKIRSVKQRLYRGRCRHNGQLDGTIRLFNERRGELETHLVPDSLSERDQKSAKKYVDAFYDIVNKPKKRQRKLLEACVGS